MIRRPIVLREVRRESVGIMVGTQVGTMKAKVGTFGVPVEDENAEIIKN